MGEVDNEIMERLQEWENREGQLPRVVQLYRELLHIQSEAKSRVVIVIPAVSDDILHDRLCQGIPLLLSTEFSPDWHDVQVAL